MIRFDYQPTWDDYLALNHYALLRRSRILFIIAGVITILFLLSPLTARVHPEAKSTLEIYRSNLGLLCVLGAFAAVPIATRLAAKKRWTAAAELRETKVFEIDESGLRVTARNFSGFLEWQLVTYAEFWRGYFLLQTGQNQFHYFPSSVVPDKKSLAELVRRKVARTKNLDNA